MKAAIVIGVDAINGDLPRLRAAASSAVEVASWLRRSEYEVNLFTDEDGPVTRSDIFSAVTSLVHKCTVKQLVIYFAGHGFLKGPLDEHWLLSGAPVDPSESVNVTYSAAAARYRGIPRIIFISDACRVAPKSDVHSGITGGSIFPNIAPTPRSAEIDFYYATQPGDPAYERDATEAECAHGLFTKELLDAHKEAPPEALLTIGRRLYVRNDWLKDVLEERVCASAENISLRLTQIPDVQIQMRDGYIALKDGDTPSVRTRNFSAKRGHPSLGLQTAIRKRRSGSTYGPDGIIKDRARENKRFKERLGVLQRAEQAGRIRVRDDVFETHLTCVGDKFAVIASGSGLLAELSEQEIGTTYRIRLAGNSSQVAVQFSDGCGMLLPVLSDYACEVVRDEGRTLSVSYSCRPFQDPWLGELRAEVLSAATLGLLDLNSESARALAQKLRRGKRSDPILGLVAALAYALAGDSKGASSVREYMRRDLNVDLFDSWLLGGAGKDLPIQPKMPLLAQTWNFLEVFGTPFAEEMKHLRRVAGFWTVFEADAMDKVAGLVQSSKWGF
ncbi:MULTISPECIES: caspase family protein [Mameliella]|uniref:caspase family protein n=1 Tax=Mameliella TaxID=1434019 RepID=UPI000EB5EE78|nr:MULTISPECIES: caspase family protein [Mameliella]MCR9272539.1 caspase family protein [Paracoccaceae bacterium]